MRAGKASGLKSLFITFLIILTVYFLIITASQSREDAESGSEPGVVSAPSGAASADPSDTPSDAPPVSDTPPESRPETPTDFTAEQLEYVKELESVLEDLLGYDHMLTELFINRSVLLSGDYSGNDPFEPFPLDKGSPYENYSAVTELFGLLFGGEGEGSREFESFPDYGPAAVSERDGKTYVTSHYIVDFDIHFFSGETEVLDIDSSGAKLYTQASDGTELFFSASRTKNGWFLDRGMYFVYRDAREAAEAQADWTESPDFSTGMNEGSAKRLAGDCLIVNVFLDDPVSGWTSEDVSAVFGFLDGGIAFLEAEAGAAGVELDLEYTDSETSLFLRAESVIPIGLDEFRWTVSLFEEAGEGSLEKFVENNVSLDGYDNYCVMLHVNKQSRSYAIPCDSGYYDYKTYETERCVIFYSEGGDYAYRPNESVYMHEMLHLFGADDLYDPYVEGEKLALIEEYCPYELMRYIPDDIQEVSLSPLTRFLIGWENRLDDQFAVFSDAA